MYDMYQEVVSLAEEVFKVLANQKRLEIIQLLKNRELNVTEMADMLGLRQPNLSQHLTLLRQYKLVAVTKRGQKIYYRLTSQDIGNSVDLIYRFLVSQHGLDQQVIEKIPDNLYPIAQDPVCGMRLSVTDAFGRVAFQKRDYYFCASGCKKAFISNPTKYISHKEGVAL